MKKVVDLDLSKNPILQKGDIVQFWDGVAKLDGIVLKITRRYTQGDIAGQAMAANIAVAGEGSQFDKLDETWYLFHDVPFTDIICRRWVTLMDFEPREGKVLQFECKAQQDKV